MNPADRSSGRRSYDREIDPVVENFIEERLRETRHELRQEIQSVAAAVAGSAMQASKDHAAVELGLQQVKDKIESQEDRSEALDRLRSTMRNTAFSLAALIVAVAGVLFGLSH